MKVVEYKTSETPPDCNAWSHISTIGMRQTKQYLHEIGEDAIMQIGPVYLCERCLAHYIQTIETSRKVRLHIRV